MFFLAFPSNNTFFRLYALTKTYDSRKLAGGLLMENGDDSNIFGFSSFVLYVLLFYSLGFCDFSFYISHTLVDLFFFTVPQSKSSFVWDMALKRNGFKPSTEKPTPLSKKLRNQNIERQRLICFFNRIILFIRSLTHVNDSICFALSLIKIN